jgi:hypothetical protein
MRLPLTSSEKKVLGFILFMACLGTVLLGMRKLAHVRAGSDPPRMPTPRG